MDSPPIDISKKACGDCTACCIFLPISAGQIDEQAKPAGVPCRHLGPVGMSHGCRIYEDRCETCRRFQCGWLADSAWPDPWRPDRSGLLIVREWLPEIGMGAVVYETIEAAFLQLAARRMIDLLGRHCRVVCLVGLDGRRRTLRSEPVVSGGPGRPHFLARNRHPHSAPADSPLPLFSPAEIPLSPRESV